ISWTCASGTERALRAEIASRPPPAAHPGNDDRPIRAIFRREPRGTVAHVPRARVLVGVRHRVCRRVRPVGIGGGRTNSRAGAGGRAGGEREGADASGLRVASGRNGARVAWAEPSAAAPATMMTAVARLIFALAR